jgi:hypothetical protein
MSLATSWWAGFGLDPEWYGLFIAAAANGYLVVAHFTRPDWARNWGTLAVLLGTAALVVAHLGVAADGGDRGALPAAYAIAFVGAAGAYGRWRWAEPAGLMPPLGALATLTTWWAARGLALEWYGVFVAGAAIGYLILAQFDRRDRDSAWRWSAGACSALSLALVHRAVAIDEEARHAALPITYGIVLASAAASFARWQFSWRVAPAALPALLAMTAVTTGWAGWGLAPSGTASSLRPPASATWRLVTSTATDGAPLGHWRPFGGCRCSYLPHVAVVIDGAESAPLPLTYGICFVGASAAFARWRWMEAGALLPPLAAMTALTTWWAAGGLGVEWYGSFAAATAFGYLLLAHLDRPLRTRYWQLAAAFGSGLGLVMTHLSVAGDPEATREALPAAYAIVTAAAAAAFAVWRYAWRVAPAALPVAVSLAALTFSWARWELQPHWYGAFVVAATFGYVLHSMGDERAWMRPWLGAAMGVGLASVLLAQLTQDVDAARAALPVTYGQALAAAAISTAWWRWLHRESVATLPALGAAFGASLAWAAFEMPLEWLAAWTAAAAVGYLVPAALDRSKRANWRAGALAGGGLSLLVAHSITAQSDVSSWQLPVTYESCSPARAGMPRGSVMRACSLHQSWRRSSAPPSSGPPDSAVNGGHILPSAWRGQ